jgi:hypothetical protein
MWFWWVLNRWVYRVHVNERLRRLWLIWRPPAPMAMAPGLGDIGTYLGDLARPLRRTIFEYPGIRKEDHHQRKAERMDTSRPKSS